MKQQFLDLSGLTDLVTYIKDSIANKKVVLPYASNTLFPSVGDINSVYIDTATNSIYRWDPTNTKYELLAKAVKSVSISESTEDGKIILTVDGVKTTVPIHGLGSAAYTESSAYATASQGTKAESAVQSVSLSTGTNNGTVKLTVDKKTTDNIAVKGLGSAAYTDSSIYADTDHTHTKAQVGLGNVDNTADADKSVKHATSADSTPWSGVTNKPSTYPPSSHNHDDSTITSLNASKLFGTIDIARLPQGALERLVVVEDDTARFKLTTADVQLGDTVKVTKTTKMYYVIDENNLSSESGYSVYTAGSATSAPWSGITGKPTTYPPSDHTHPYLSALSASGTTITYTKGDGSTGTIVTQDTVYSHPTTSGNKHIPSGGSSGQILRWSADGTAVWGADNNTTYNDATTSTHGLMSTTDKSKLDSIEASANKYIHPSYTARTAGLYKITVDTTGHVSGVVSVVKSDITGLGIPAQDTTYSTFKGATSSVAGGTGLVPAPASGQTGLYLRSDGTWGTPTNTTYNDVTTSAHGLMTAADKTKLDGVATGANNYTHPSYTAYTSGLYKVTVDATGHVSAATAVTKTDITNLGIPSTNTTYSNMTAATASTAGTAGLVPAPAAGKQTSFLRGDGTWVVPTNTTYSTFKGATSSTAGGSGLVPAPTTDNVTQFLRGDGTWATPYTHPSATAYVSGLYKITTNNLGHVTAATAVTKADITALGIPASDTTYTVGTESYSGTTKLYTETGTATDGTMTQSAITTALNGKSDSSHTHNYAGSSSAGGSANSAVKLATAITINGTSFDGSANITTARWGTARTITVGNTSKSVNGSANVSWSLAEVGVRVSTSEPTSSDGENGDVWIVYET